MKEIIDPKKTSLDELHKSYVSDLKAHVTRYLAILESIFGPRDPRFVFNTIRMSDESPSTHFPGGFHFRGDCRVDIFITRWPWEHCSPDQGPWQIAHECVHLLDPGKFGSTNVLEEGLATWFQNEPSYQDELVRCYIAKNEKPLPAYADAEKLVRSSLPGILNAVKALRAVGVRIRDIKADMLASLLPSTETETLERLCTRFQD